MKILANQFVKLKHARVGATSVSQLTLSGSVECWSDDLMVMVTVGWCSGFKPDASLELPMNEAVQVDNLLGSVVSVFSGWLIAVHAGMLWVDQQSMSECVCARVFRHWLKLIFVAQIFHWFLFTKYLHFIKLQLHGLVSCEFICSIAILNAAVCVETSRTAAARQWWSVSCWRTCVCVWMIISVNSIC